MNKYSLNKSSFLLFYHVKTFINRFSFQRFMETAKKCLATNVRITNDKGAVTFKCPNCNDYEIVRSKNARQIVAKYTCPKCGFTGPN